MISYFSAELKRAVLSQKNLIAMLLVLVSLFIGMMSSWDSIAEFKGVSLFLYAFSLGSGAILPVVAPLIVGLPFSNAYLEDRENHMIYGILTRTTLKTYYIVKIASNSLASALSIMLPLTLFLLTNRIMLPFEKGLYFGEIGGAWSSVFRQHQMLYAILTVINSGIFAAVYANLGLVSTFFIRNKLASAVIPFGLYLLPSFVFPFIRLDRFEPVTTFDLTANTTANVLSVYGQLLLILSVTLVVGFFRLKKEVIIDDSTDD
ncbi:ABC transporter permease [Streptococcus sp. E17BB]|uniref:ABC transporter permease n=1 Tax=Streptococcus sp. E17BB TaxID=3278714 RepID=UPI00359EA63E